MKKTTSLLACCFVFTFLFITKSYGQALTSDDIKNEMVGEWERSKAYTIEYLNTMPADKYSFRAVDSIRSFAQQMLHLAQANVFLMSIATGGQVSPWVTSNPENRASAHTKDSVMYYVLASYDYCINAVKTSDINKWGEKVKVFGRFEETRFAMLNKTLEHQAHHRGQTTVYIRLQGIKPPQEKLF